MQRVEISRNRGPKWNDAPRGRPRRCASLSCDQFTQLLWQALLAVVLVCFDIVEAFSAACMSLPAHTLGQWLAVRRRPGGARPLQTATGAGPPPTTGGAGTIAAGPPPTTGVAGTIAADRPPMSRHHAGAPPPTSLVAGVPLSFFFDERHVPPKCGLQSGSTRSI